MKSYILLRYPDTRLEHALGGFCELFGDCWPAGKTPGSISPELMGAAIEQLEITEQEMDTMIAAGFLTED